MKKVLVILKREYMIRVKTKAFVIGTIISPLLMLALIVLPGFLATRGGGERQVTVIDQSGDPQLYEAVRRRLSASVGDAQTADASRGRARDTEFVLSHVAIPPDKSIEEVKAEYNERVDKDTDKAYVILRPGVLEGVEPEYRAKSVSDFSITAIERAISAAITERRLVRAGIDPEKVTTYTRPVDLKRIKVGPEGESEESGAAGFIVGFVMLFFIYMSILFYGLFVMRGVIEEKQSRIVEVIASSVKPTQMMMGKLVGIGLVGLTQFGIWVGSAMLLTKLGMSMAASQGFTMPDLPASLLIYFILFFILGYFLYATLYAMVGAMVSSEEEAQQAQVPVTILIVLPMMVFGLVMNNPNSGLSTALSLIPFFAPTLMMLRIAMANPPMWQVILSMALMVLTILGAVWVAAKIYRVGILMYGKRPSLTELGRWLRYT